MSSLPSIVSQIPADLRRFLDRVREALDKGDLVTRDELVAGGIAALSRGGSLTLPDGTPIVPPAPTGFTVTGSMTSIILEWNEPTYKGHAYTEIWRAAINDIGQARLIGQAPGHLFADAVGSDASFFYWIRFISTSGPELGAGPFNATAGLHGNTVPDLEYILQQLTSAYGSTSAAPFFQLDQPMVIGGRTIPAGTYIKSAFIHEGQLTSAMIQNLVADKITAGYTTSVDIEGGTFFGSELYLGGSPAYEFNDPAAPQKRTGIASVSNPRIALSGQGARFAVDAFLIMNGDQGYAPFIVVDGVAYLDKARIREGDIDNSKIGNIIQSTNFQAGVSGWQVKKDGTAEFNGATFRGTIQSGNYQANGAGWRLDTDGNIELNAGVFRGTLDIKTSASGARLEIRNDVIKVYDQNGVLRVKLGNLSA